MSTVLDDKKQESMTSWSEHLQMSTVLDYLTYSVGCQWGEPLIKISTVLDGRDPYKMSTVLAYSIQIIGLY